MATPLAHEITPAQSRFQSLDGVRIRKPAAPILKKSVDGRRVCLASFSTKMFFFSYPFFFLSLHTPP